MRLSLVLLLLAPGCGRIHYADSSRPVAVAQASAGGTVVVVPNGAPPVAPAAPVAPSAQAPGVVYVPWDPGAQPEAPTYVEPPPPVAVVQAPRGGAVRCGGNERVRIHDRIVDGRGGPGVVATGGCVVEISEAIIRGEPALVVLDNARVVLVESRIQGDMRSSAGAQISTRGCRHDRGHVIQL